MWKKKTITEKLLIVETRNPVIHKQHLHKLLLFLLNMFQLRQIYHYIELCETVVAYSIKTDAMMYASGKAL